MTTIPLKGIRVLDLSRLLPGPYCTLLLGDLGAEVIMVGVPRAGDVEWRSSLSLLLNRNKKSITLNLKTEKGREIFYDLAKKSHVILESFRPKVKDRLGISYDIVKQVNPKIIYCSLSGYGQDGPYRDLPGHDVNYVGVAGVLSFTGKIGKPPIIPGIQIADIAGGMFSALSILAALITLNNTGKGQFIDVSMLDGVISWLTFHAATYFSEGKPPQAESTVLIGSLPGYNLYETKDGRFITLGNLERHFWANLCKVLSREDLIQYQYATGKKRDEICSFLDKTFRTKTMKEWIQILRKADVCCGPVYNLDETFSDPQVIHREILTEMSHPLLGKINQIKMPVKFSEASVQIKSPPPKYGQHTMEVLQSLGYTEEGIKGMREAGIV